MSRGGARGDGHKSLAELDALLAEAQAEAEALQLVEQEANGAGPPPPPPPPPPTLGSPFAVPAGAGAAAATAAEAGPVIAGGAYQAQLETELRLLRETAAVVDVETVKATISECESEYCEQLLSENKVLRVVQLL